MEDAMTGGWRGQLRLFERKPVMTTRDIVRSRLVGLEVRQRARDERRRAQAARKAATAEPVQGSLDEIAMRDPLVARGRA